jgi:hypothetical protein
VEGEDFEAAVAARRRCRLLVVTRSEHGAIAIVDGVAHAVPAEPIDPDRRHDRRRRSVRRRLPGRPGAGPLGRGVPADGRDRAAEIISHYGARAEAKLESW